MVSSYKLHIHLLCILPSEYSLHGNNIFPASWSTSTLDVISQEQHSQQKISYITTCIDIKRLCKCEVLNIQQNICVQITYIRQTLR